MIPRRHFVIGTAALLQSGCLRNVQNTQSQTAQNPNTVQSTTQGSTTPDTTVSATQTLAESSEQPVFSKQWTAEADLEGDRYNSPVVATENEIVVGGETRRIRGFDSKSGELLWSKTRGGKGVIISHPTVATGKAVFSNRSGELVAYNVRDGSVSWKGTIPYTDRTYSFVHDDNVICINTNTSSGKTSLVAFDLETGKREWSLSSTDLANEKTPYIGFEGGISDVYNDRILIMLSNISVTVNVARGTVVERRDIRYYVNYPGVTWNGTVYLSGEETVYAISRPDQSLNWEFSPDRGATTGCTVYKDKVLFGAADRNIYALNRSDGTQDWTTSTFNEVNCRPIIHSDMVLAGSDDRHLYILNLETGDKLDRIQLKDELRAIVSSGSSIIVLTSSSIHGVKLN